MDKRPDADCPETADTQTPVEAGPATEETSRQYLARWDRLLSTTNWEKGRIICEWRQALIEAGAASGSYTDEAWSRRAGGLSRQHAGRLRSVYRRFGQVHQQYAGLYWSHFQAALDWPDAEMWLEGAVHSGWPVARMRHQHWQSIGAPAHKKPRDQDVIAAEFDEDFIPAGQPEVPGAISDSLAVVREAPPMARRGNEFPSSESGDADTSRQPPIDAFESFENFAPLPPDMNKAFQFLQRSIQRHKRAGWRKVPLGDVLALLDAMKQLALQPADN